MKKTFTIILLTAILSSCADEGLKAVDEIIESGDISAMQTKKEQIIKSYDSIGAILGKLDMAIARIDTMKKLPMVSSIVINEAMFNHFIDVQGYVDTSENLLIYPEFQGVLTQVLVNEGSKVSKGQLLAKIDDGGLINQLSQLETQYQLAKTTFERQDRLWKQNIGSEIQYLQAKSNMEAAESAVSQIRSQVERTSVRAPFSGEIDKIITEQGQVVGPGSQPLMRIINLNNMYVKASIPENYLGSIVKGSNVIVTFPAIDKKTYGTVHHVGNYINPSNRTFEIEIKISNRDNSIKPNLVAKLEINNYSKEHTILIPANVIQENSKGEKYVFLIKDKVGDEAKAVRNKIQTGLKYEGEIEVISGLKSGDTIVAAGALSLTDGASIKIKPTKQN